MCGGELLDGLDLLVGVPERGIEEGDGIAVLVEEADRTRGVQEVDDGRGMDGMSSRDDQVMDAPERVILHLTLSLDDQLGGCGLDVRTIP